MEVVNKSRVDFEYRQGQQGVLIKKTIFSNTVSTDVINQLLTVEKQVDKAIATLCEVLFYNITISNISAISVTNVFFQDIPPEGTKFIMNSVKVNGEKRRCVNPNDGFYLGTIDPQNSLSVSFKVVVLSKESNHSINNQSDIFYDYIYNTEMPPTRVPIYSNEVSTIIEKRLFKQFNVSNTLILSPCMPLIDSIIRTSVKVCIIDTKLVATPIIYENNTKNLNLFKLIIIGTIEYKVKYKYHKCGFNEYTNEEENDEEIQELTDKEGFSTFLLVPCGIQYCEGYSVSIFIENISKLLLDKKSLFIDVELLVNL